MLFKKQMQGITMETPMGDTLGKLDGLIIDTTTWKVQGLVVSPGALKKTIVYNLTDITSFDDRAKKIVIKREIEPQPFPEHPSATMMPLRELMAKKVVTADDETLKSVYDVDFGTKLKSWDVWKLLIQTPMKERRLRISPKDVKEVAASIVLTLTLDEIEQREAEAEAED